MKITEMCDYLFPEITKLAYRSQHYERSAFDPIARGIFEIIFKEALKTENTGAIDMASIWISRQLGATRKQVRSRLKHLARYGFIRIVCKKRPDGSGLNECNQIDVNPILVGTYRQQSGIKPLRQFVEHYFTVGFKRLDDDENDIQGFWSDCKYGMAEPERGSQPTWQSRLIAFNERKDESAKQKQRENYEWVNHSNGFIEGAAKLWTTCQGKLGYGYNKPTWDGDLTIMPVAAKRERSELSKLFQSQGGLKTAVAWYVFCAGLPQYDEIGKLLWDNKSPHRQFITIDKKPAQFAKHFNAIMADKIFIEIWNNDDGKLDKLKENLNEYFGDYLNIKARNYFADDERFNDIE